MSERAATRYEPIAVSSESTVVAEFMPDGAPGTGYQSEADLEREFIKLLQSQAYDYLSIRTEAQLVANLRIQLGALNGITFTDAEWKRFFANQIAGTNEGIAEKTVRVQEDHVQVLKRDDGSTKNILLIDKTNIHKQPPAGNQPIRGRPAQGWCRALQPLRRDSPRQRPADRARRTQAARRGHPRGVQSD